ncbi:MAG: type II toxin-antitoxin system VapC family toxin [Treponema sp.]|nr:type II toxin-antitoxin system VapC family toxin [Treponema sp.]MBQ2530624.1 type II toxin-antitoxin system VapC family toxin [Treponema sp.]
MNGTDFLADTNALIYLLDGNPCMVPYLQKKLAFSVISEMELLSFSGITKSEEEKIKSFLSDCKEISLSDEIKETVIKLRKNYRIKLPDAIIAASALANKIPLITADKGFCQISELCLELIVPVLGQ